MFAILSTGNPLSGLLTRLRQQRGNRKAVELTERIESLKSQNVPKEDILDMVNKYGLYLWMNDCY